MDYNCLQKKVLETSSGTIHYWVNIIDENAVTLVFLPGLTADHRLFDRQLEHFAESFNVFVWDAPGHGLSWPFELDFSLEDKAVWLGEIFDAEGIAKPVIIGQSMGGYVGQAFIQKFHGRACGFISVDSAPLKREFITGAELLMLKHTEAMYRYYPWKRLLRDGTRGVAETEYGRQLMLEIMMTYDGDKRRYSMLAGHGFRIIAQAIERKLPYDIDCKALLICGRKDKAGSSVRYNRAWHEKAGIPIRWIDDAGHNSNTDCPQIVNEIIEEFVADLCR